MFEVDTNNHIHISKGESATLNIVLFEPDGSIYELNEGDTLQLSIQGNDNAEPVIFELNEDGAIEFLHEKTKKLEPGLQKYNILLYTKDGKYFYVVGPEVFEVVDVIEQSDNS